MEADLINSSKNHSIFESLPPLTPDIIDDFITWAYPRFCLYSFQNSTIDFKRKKLEEFFKELPEEKRQYQLDL